VPFTACALRIELINQLDIGYQETHAINIPKTCHTSKSKQIQAQIKTAKKATCGHLKAYQHGLYQHPERLPWRQQPASKPLSKPLAATPALVRSAQAVTQRNRQPQTRTAWHPKCQQRRYQADPPNAQ